MILLGKLNEGESVFERTEEIRRFITSVPLSKNTEFIEGSTGLSIVNPSQYRRELLTSIIEDIKFISNSLGDGISIKIEGLDTAISVRQYNQSDVQLSIPYTFSLEYENGGLKERE